MRFDRSWIPGIAAIVGLVLLQRAALPRELLLLLAGAVGGWLLRIAWGIWRNPAGAGSFSVGAPRVQYWRGQRIELEPPRRSARRPSAPPTRQMAIALLYGLSGALALAALVVGLINRFA